MTRTSYCATLAFVGHLYGRSGYVIDYTPSTTKARESQSHGLLLNKFMVLIRCSDFQFFQNTNQDNERGFYAAFAMPGSDAHRFHNCGGFHRFIRQIK